MKINWEKTAFIVTLIFASITISASADLVVSGLGTTDSMIRNALPTSNFGSDVGGFIGTTAANSLLREVFSFDLSSLGSIDEIDSVTLTLTQRTPDATSVNKVVDLSLVLLTQSFLESSVTWNNRQTSTPWTTAGGTFGSVLATTSASTKAALNTQITFASTETFVTAAQAAYNAGTPLYLAVYAPGQEALTDRALISTYFKENSAGVPTLTVTTIPEAATSSYFIVFGLLCVGLRARMRH